MRVPSHPVDSHEIVAFLQARDDSTRASISTMRFWPDMIFFFRGVSPFIYLSVIVLGKDLWLLCAEARAEAWHEPGDAAPSCLKPSFMPWSWARGTDLLSLGKVVMTQFSPKKNILNCFIAVTT